MGAKALVVHTTVLHVMGSLGILEDRSSLLSPASSPPSPSAALRLPGVRMNGGNTVAGRYRAESSLGSGPFGFVLAAHSIAVQRKKVALKILASATSMSAARRALAGAHRSSALKSEHIARVIDTGFTEDAVGFIATEKLEGHSLAEELFARGPLPAWEAVRWILEACEGLAEAHAQGIVHGDLKPTNLFLAKTTASGSRTLKILDFGMALMPFADDECNDVESFEGNTAATAPLFASPAYLAPERLHESSTRLDPRVDIWSLGVILHQLIAGSLPFMADTVSGMLVAVAYDAPALLAAPDVSYDLARVVHACLAKDPAARPRNVAVLAKQLAPFAGPTGQDLATRVLDSARSAAPPPPASIAAMTVSLPPPKKSSQIPAPPPSVRFTKTLKGLSPFDLDAALPKAAKASASTPLPLNEKAERRRKIAIATVGAAAVLAVAGVIAPLMAPPSSSPQEVGNATIHSGDLPIDLPIASSTDDRPNEEERLTTRAFVPPSFGVAEPEIESVAALPSLPSTPAVQPSGVKATSPSKPKAGVLVREDPYSRGFTHPTRLTDRRK